MGFHFKKQTKNIYKEHVESSRFVKNHKQNVLQEIEHLIKGHHYVHKTKKNYNKEKFIKISMKQVRRLPLKITFT